MTGFGQARGSGRDGARIRIEARSVNHKSFRLGSKLPSGFAEFEGEVESLVRRRISRGSVDLLAELSGDPVAERRPLNTALARSYLADLRKLQKTLRIAGEPTIETVLDLPGVVGPLEDPRGAAARQWPKVKALIQKAVKDLVAMRLREGGRLRKELAGILAGMERTIEKVAGRAPAVVEAFRDRLTEKIRALLAGTNVQVGPQDLAREVALFAERCDIAEEIARLRSHVKEFSGLLAQEGEVGRKLDFLAQEMLRESNTIGSKSNDAQVSQWAVALKTDVDRIKEQVQNIE